MQGFCVADFAMLSDERRSHLKIFRLFIWINEICVQNLKGSNIRNFLGLHKLKVEEELPSTSDLVKADNIEL